jgi:hypothetical protein
MTATSTLWTCCPVPIQPVARCQLHVQISSQPVSYTPNIAGYSTFQSLGAATLPLARWCCGSHARRSETVLAPKRNIASHRLAVWDPLIKKRSQTSVLGTVSASMSSIGRVQFAIMRSLTSDMRLRMCPTSCSQWHSLNASYAVP